MLYMAGGAWMRIRSLDAVRGIAAVIVLLWHVSLTITATAHQPSWLFASPLRMLVAGPPAVILFFVLSGLVLAPSASLGREYLPYIVSRCIRIWMPFAASIVIAVILCGLLGQDPLRDVTGWFNYSWSDPVSGMLVLHHLLMTGAKDTLNNPAWSLFHEMRIAFILPFFVVGLRLRPMETCAATLILLIIASWAIHLTDRFIVRSILTSMQYVSLFVAGSLIAINAKSVSAWIDARSPRSIAIAWILGVGLLCFPPFQVGWISGPANLLWLLLQGVGACIILSLCLSDAATPSFLLGRATSFLGQISYSLYLTHMLVLISVVRLMDGHAPSWMGTLLSVSLVFPFAMAFHHWIERPSSMLARHLAKQVPIWFARSASWRLHPDARGR
ncbi:acyltransferase [Sphingomonas sp. SORGH_AS_0802]|uniref:acyltransferase family protein n=2 Tax=unclassified Sphingomonas TaxID=196159 RepID=UPI00286B65E0|nr:acyltransferase [Sphingomonas sp. SORGH_AS_0802]